MAWRGPSILSAGGIGCALLLLTGCGETPVPTVPEAQGEECVRPVEEMRRDHPDILAEGKREAVREGIRRDDQSLRACIECHVAPTEDRVSRGAEDDGHFCVNCHEYTAVSIDCFQCHAERPAESAGFAADHGLHKGLPRLSMVEGRAEPLADTEEVPAVVRAFPGEVNDEH